MKLAVIQHDIFWEELEENFAHLAGLVGEAAAAGARLVLLSEMFSYGFSMDVAKIAEMPDGPSSQFLVDQARKHRIWLGGTIPVLAGAAKARNTFVLAAPDGSTYSYAKIHPFTYGGEDEHYEGGDSLKQVQVEDIRVSLSVCYDLRFPYVFWPLAETTDLYLVPANWPAKRRRHWQSLLVARAIENEAYVAGINRVGTGGGIHYSGDSAIISPLGETISSASPPLAQTEPTSTPETDNPPTAEAAETILYAEIDPAEVASTRSRFPFLQDRRPEI